jgi:hypothetical protein
MFRHGLGIGRRPALELDVFRRPPRRTSTPARADEDTRACLDGWLCIIERDLRDCQNGGDARDLLDDYRFWREHWPEMNGPGVQGRAKNE